MGLLGAHVVKVLFIGTINREELAVSPRCRSNRRGGEYLFPRVLEPVLEFGGLDTASTISSLTSSEPCIHAGGLTSSLLR